MPKINNKTSNTKPRNLVVSNPENCILTCKTTKNVNYCFGRKKKHSLFADTKLSVEQIERKL